MSANNTDWKITIFKPRAIKIVGGSDESYYCFRGAYQVPENKMEELKIWLKSNATTLEDYDEETV